MFRLAAMLHHVVIYNMHSSAVEAWLQAKHLKFGCKQNICYQPQMPDLFLLRLHSVLGLMFQHKWKLCHCFYHRIEAVEAGLQAKHLLPTSNLGSVSAEVALSLASRVSTQLERL